MDVKWENAILHPCTWKFMDVKWEICDFTSM
jgi:hypothetical protein